MTIVGTRPEIIRLSRYTRRAGTPYPAYPRPSGQNYDYELNQVFSTTGIAGARPLSGGCGKTPANRRPRHREGGRGSGY